MMRRFRLGMSRPPLLRNLGRLGNQLDHVMEEGTAKKVMPVSMPLNQWEVLLMHATLSWMLLAMGGAPHLHNLTKPLKKRLILS
jgi:hypothetical protein